MSVEIRYDDESAWLEARLRGVGASETPALLRLVSWHSEFSLWTEKTQQLPHELLDTPRLRRGRLLEPLVATEYEHATGRKLRDPGRRTVQWSRRPDGSPGVLFCTLDRIIEASDEPCIACRKIHVGPGVLEAKSTYGFNAEEWDEDAPLAPQVQLQTQLGITELGWGVAGAWIGLEDFRFYCYDADPKLYRLIEKKAERFWRCVRDGVPPDIDGSEATHNALARLHPEDSGETIDLPPEAAIDLAILEQASEERKKWERVEEEQKNRLRARLGRATYGRIDGTTVSLKTVRRRGYTVGPTTFRELRRKTE